jgi:hypothetical protein
VPRAVALGLDRGGPIVLVVAVLVVARTTLLPGVGFWDTAEFQAVPPLLGTLHPTGFPAYTVLGWVASVLLQPFGTPAYRMNLFSAICVAGAVGCTAILVRGLTGRGVLGIATGAVLFLTQITWDISTHADAHSLHLLLLALLFVLLVGWERRERAGARVGGPRASADRWLVAAAGVYAVAVANHSLSLLVAPGLVLFVFAVAPGILRRPGLVGRCVLVFTALVVALYLELPLRAGPFRAAIVYGHPETWDGFRYIVLAEQFRGDLGSPFADLGPKLGGLVDLAARQLGPLAALLPVGALATALRRPRYAALTLPTLIITCFFAVSYSNADIDRYYLGPLLIGLTWIAVLVDGLIGGLVGASGSVAALLRRTAGPWSAASFVGLGLALELAAAVVLAAPAAASASATRHEVDEHDVTTASDWLDRILVELRPDAVVISWWGYSTPLWYARDVEGRRTDITVIDDRTRLDENLGEVADVIDSYLGKRPVYIIRLPGETADLAGRYDLAALPDEMDSGLALVLHKRTTPAPAP